MPAFQKLAQEPDEAIDVALGAVLVAKDVREDVDVDATLAALRRMTEGDDWGAEAPQRQAELVTERFRKLGFRGNTEDYYDPANSLLPDVLERRTGIPITLSIVWCEIARRAGVIAHGVGFPGHFLVRVDRRGAPADAPILVDPFGGGRILDDHDTRELLRRALGEGAVLHPSMLTAASPRAVLVRLLGNLKAIWANRGEHARALLAIDRMVTLMPDSARMLRERAGVALRLGIADLARRDLARVLELEPQAPDTPLIEKRLAELAARPAPRPN